MAKKQITPCENQEFLPQEVADSEKAALDTAQKNLLGTLCFYYINYCVYAAKHDGWFFKDQDTLFEESNLSAAQGKRVLLKLVLKKLIERTSGTNHRCTHYRLHKGIIDLLPQNPELEESYANEPLIEDHYDSESAGLEGQKTANEPLDKNRLDESRKDESSQGKKTEENNVSYAPIEEGATTHKKLDEIYLEELAKAKTAREVTNATTKFVQASRDAMYVIPDERIDELKRIQEKKLNEIYFK